MKTDFKLYKDSFETNLSEYEGSVSLCSSKGRVLRLGMAVELINFQSSREFKNSLVRGQLRVENDIRAED